MPEKNFAYSTVATAPSPASTGTSLVVASGQGALFPTVPFYATVWPVDVQPLTTNAEIIRVSARSTDTLTIARGQEGSTARSVIVGDQIAATLTARTLVEAAHPRKRYVYWNDFLSAPSATGNDLIINNSGTGAATLAQSIADNNRIGIVRATTGTTTTGRAVLSTFAAGLCLGQGAAIFEAAVNVTALSDAAERFTFMAGFFDTTSDTQADAVCFRYDEGGVGAGSAASANWQTLTASNSTRTNTTTGVAVAAATWETLRIEINAAGTQVNFFIDGVDTGTAHTTNIPINSARSLGFGFLLLKSVGTTARTVDYDYCACDIDLTTARV